MNCTEVISLWNGVDFHCTSELGHLEPHEFRIEQRTRTHRRLITIAWTVQEKNPDQIPLPFPGGTHEP